MRASTVDPMKLGPILRSCKDTALESRCLVFSEGKPASVLELDLTEKPGEKSMVGCHVDVVGRTDCFSVCFLYSISWVGRCRASIRQFNVGRLHLGVCNGWQHGTRRKRIYSLGSRPVT